MLGFFRFKMVWFFKVLDATYKIIYLLFSLAFVASIQHA